MTAGAPDRGRADALMREAFAEHEAGHVAAAERLYREILALDPDYADAHYLLGRLAQDRGAWAEVVDHVRRALRTNDREPAFHRTLGTACFALGQWLDVITHLRRVVELDPDDAASWIDLGCACDRLGRTGEAAACFERALALEPDSPVALNNYAHTLKNRGRVEDAIPLFRKARTLVPGHPDFFSNYLYSLSYSPDLSPAAIWEEHRQYDAVFGSGRDGPVDRTPVDPDPERPLRIGYFSPDFRAHPVHVFIEPLLRHHDRAQVEVCCYSLWPWRDAVTARLQPLADRWADCGALDDAALCERIAGDRIDILVDLAGHTGGNRLPVLGRKPAPVIATWLGYPNTTGLRTVDYRITDATCDPPGVTDAYHSERVWRLPQPQWCYGRPEFDVAVSPSPAAQHDGFCFGSFNHASKLNERMFALWAEILRRVPRAWLLVWGVGDEQRTRIVEAFARHGIAGSRVECVDRTSFREQLELYRRVDVALDTHPYSGVTTTFNAAWMGVPAVTLAGDGLASRSSASILGALGLQDWVTAAPERYVERAVRAAAEVPALAELRRTLRPRLEASVLMDGPGFARTLEAAYRAMWRTRLAAAAARG